MFLSILFYKEYCKTLQKCVLKGQDHEFVRIVQTRF